MGRSYLKEIIEMKSIHTCHHAFVYVIAWFAVVFGINSMSNAEIIVRGAAEYNLLHYECYTTANHAITY